MNTRTLNTGSRRTRVVKGLLLQVATKLTALAANIRAEQDARIEESDRAKSTD